mmetsp:Transcript_5727/g.13767  ORF Transcript_5727/g.13767 Transcript_5727/m.13767 type:complete len:97 (+) Transcript_5727:1303-1593(+)
MRSEVTWHRIIGLTGSLEPVDPVKGLTTSLQAPMGDCLFRPSSTPARGDMRDCSGVFRMTMGDILETGEPILCLGGGDRIVKVEVLALEEMVAVIM